MNPEQEGALVDSVPTDLAVTITRFSPKVGPTWLDRLPALITRCEQAWSIKAMAPFEGLSFSYVAPALRADGTEVILKLGLSHCELRTEIEALSLYDGRGCAKLVAADQSLGALLIERLKPGLSLSSIADDDEATRIVARVMRSLWRPVPLDHAFPSVGRWASGLDRMREHFEGGTGPLPKDLVEKAEGLFLDLLSSMDEPVLLHGDLHPGNILSAQRQPWLAVDPKGVVGEPAYETGALLRNLSPRLLAQPQPAKALARRTDVLAEELGFDRVRLLGWGLAQAVLSAWWCVEDHLECWPRFIRHARLLDSVLEGKA